jgi:hypothetical protein
MKMKVSTTFFGVLMASMLLTAPAYAEIKENDLTCPFVPFNDTELLAMSKQIATDSNGLSKEFENRFDAEASACQQKMSWTDEQTQKIVQYDVALMIAVYNADLMTKSGLELAPYDALVYDADADKLRQIIGADEKAPQLEEAITLLTKQKSDATDELAGVVGMYISATAQAKLYSLELGVVK